MADILLHRIEFLQNNPFGTFVAGDVLEVYADDSAIATPAGFGTTTGLSVDLNGSPYGSSSVFVEPNPEIVSIINYNQQICVTTYLITFEVATLWPYGSYYSQADHYSCATNPPTCDLIIIGAIDVVPSSDEATADGSLTVNAESSGTIEYNLNSDFIYGTGQSSSTFSTLLPGDYRIFIRDEFNCMVNILVTVPFSNVYAPIYRLEYDCVQHSTTKIDITKRGYVGSVTEINGADNPFNIQLRGEGSIDKFEPILASQGNLNLTSKIDGFFSTLYTNDRNLYRMEFYKDFGSGYVLLWVGKILPFIYSEEVKSPPYYTNITAIDGLTDLKNEFLIHKDGQKFFGTINLIKLVAYCLSILKLDLNIRIGCNMYADGMATTASDDPFDQAYIDYECFYLASNEPTLEFVLRSILEPFNARIVQWEGVWNIIRVEEMVDDYDYREFDYNGDYVSNSTYSPVKDVNYPDTMGLMYEAFPNLEINKGYGQIKVLYKLGLKPNIINNGDFMLKSTFVPSLGIYTFSINTDGFTIVNAGYALSSGYEKIDDGNVSFFISAGEEILENSDGGTAYVQTDTYNIKMGTNNQLKINLRYKINRLSAIFGSTTYQISVPYIKVRVRVKYGSSYLQNDGNWTSTDTTLDFFATVFNEYLESEIVANQPTTGTPVDGMNFDIRVFHAYAYYTQFQSLTNLEALPTYSGGNVLTPNGYKTELRDDFTLPSFIYYYELEETTLATSGYLVVEPDDWHTTNNPRKWILKAKLPVGTVSGANVFPFYMDRIRVTYLTGGKESIDTVIRVANAEPLNKEIFSKELIIGSFSNLIVSETNFSISLGVFFPNVTPGITITTTNILSADLIYTGWLRDVNNVGYEFWARDGVSESDKLHAIWLKSYSAQYDSSWKLLRGSLINKTGYFGLLNVISDVNDSDRIYVPIALTLDDLNNRTSGEFLEQVTLLEGSGGDGGSDGSGASAFSSAFSTAFANDLN